MQAIFWLILVLAFVSVLLLTLGIYLLVRGGKIRIRRRMSVYLKEESADLGGQESGRTSLVSTVRNAAVLTGKIIPKSKFMESKRKKLAQAAVPMKPEELFGFSIAAGLILGLLLLAITKNPLFLIIGFIVGFWIPNFLLDNARVRRVRKLNVQLPEALTIIANGLRAGYSFKQAMASVAGEMEKPISEEFSRVIRDNTMGKQMDEALVEMSTRIEDDDLEMFVTALIIQRQVGGNLAEILESIAETIRERARLKGEVRTMTAQSRISALVICVLPFGLALIIGFVNPEYIGTLFNTTIGLVLVVVAVVLEIAGIFVLSRLVKVDI